MIELTTTVNRRYRVDRQIGSGGTADVYRGHDLILGRDVAIKALRPQFAANPTFRSRFEREAEAAAGFNHPNIIDIYDVGEEGGTPYIVMEFIDGQTLKEIILNEGPFHPDDVAALLTQVGAALDYAHERGYVHRDIKPQNILVDQHGVARVVDFGIAKGLGDLDLTDVGVGLGTVHYLSPEQASGLMPTPASDIYSTGVVAFEMLTRRLPFEADSPVAVAIRHVNDQPPPPSALLPGVPPAVDAIVLKALEKDPTKRFQNAGAMARAMSSWREATPRGRPQPDQAPAAGSEARTVPRPEAFRTIAIPIVTKQPGAAVTMAPSRPHRTAQITRRDDVGCATWVVGTVILLGLVGLIWVGFQLTPRFADLGVVGNEPPATVASTEPTAATAATEPAVANASTVPDLTGMTLEEAAGVAQAAGLQLAELEPVFSDQVPVDAIAEQDPPASADVDQASTIYVKLSRGSAAIDLQSLALTGRDSAEAQRILTEAGLAVTRQETPSQDIAAGLVIGTDPADQAVVGDQIVLLVSLGDVVFIPASAQGEPVDQVRAELEAAGLIITGEAPVDRTTIEEAGLDLDEAGIEPRDVVGVQGNGANFESAVPRGTEIELVYYNPDLDESE